MPSWKQAAILSGSVLVGAGAFGALIFYLSKRGALKRVKSYFIATDEGFAETSMLYEPKEKKILVLGLEGAGKTAWLAHLAAASGDEAAAGVAGRRSSICGPTEGFKVVTISKNDRNYSIWEIGGKPNFRKYWSNFFEDVDLLVFVIDSSTKSRHTEAYDALRSVLSDQRLSNVPLLLIASKQDLHGAIKPEAILSDSGFRDYYSSNRKGGENRIQILGVSKTDGESKEAAYWKMFEMCDVF